MQRQRGTPRHRRRAIAVLALFALLTATFTSATWPRVVQAQAGLQITKTDSPDPVQEGQNLTYTVTVTNLTGVTAFNVAVTDTLPAGLTFVSAVSSQGGCVNNAGAITCAVGSVAPNQTVTITITTTVGLLGNTSLTNTSTVTGDVNRQSVTSNATATTTVQARPDLTVAKTDTPDPVVAGSNLTYTVTVTNSGAGPAPVPAGTALISDTLPEGVTFVSATGPGGYSCTNAGVAVTCTATAADSIPAAGTRVFTITVTPPTAGTIVNTVNVDSGNAIVETNNGNNSATATTTVNSATPPDLTITKTGTTGTVNAGGQITYTLTVTNSGAGPATVPAGTVLARDVLDATLTFVSATGPAGYGCTNTAGTVNCAATAADTLAPAATRVFTITVTPQATAGDPRLVNNTATTDPNNAIVEANEGNNTSGTVSTTIVAPDLEVDKITFPNPFQTSVDAGDTQSYLITVTNNGTVQSSAVIATGQVLLRDTLPPGSTFVSMTGPAGYTCTHNAGVVDCVATAPDNINEGQTRVFTVSIITPLAGTSFTNTATVDPNNNVPETDEADNTDTRTLTLNTGDLTVTKTDAPDPVVAGQALAYTVTVTNSGTGDALIPSGTVLLTDTLPAGVTFVSASGPGGYSCTHNAGIVTCTATAADSINNGSNRVFTINVTAPIVAGDITNNVTVDPNSVIPESNEGNNTDAETTTVTPGFNLLYVNTTASPNPENADQNLTVTVTIRNDPSSVVAATVPAGTVLQRFSIPTGYTLASVTGFPAGYSCAVSGSNVDCTATVADSIAVGATRTFAVAFSPPNPIGTTTSATSNLTIDPNNSLAESNEADNTDSETVTVTAPDLTVTKTDSPDPVTAGQPITYTITVTNGGDGAANFAGGQTVLSDALGAGSAFVSATPPAGYVCSEAGGTVTCIASGPQSIAAAGTIVFTIVARPTTTANVTNNVTVDPNNVINERDNLNNADSETTVVNEPDLTITKTDTPDPVVAGQNVTYTVTVTNDAGASAPAIIPAGTALLSDTLPASATFVSATGAGYTCANNAGTVSCTANAADTLNPGDSRTFTIVVTTPATGGAFSNSATADPNSAVIEANEANNTATAATVIQTPDLTIDKTGPATVNAQTDATYTVTVTNSGTAPAAIPIGTVLVRETIPTGTAFVSATAPAGYNCAVNGAVVDCTATAADSIAAAATRVFTFTFTVNTASNLSNTASVDPNLAVAESSDANNVDTFNTTVSASDLTATKTASPSGAVIVGDTITYTVTVQNQGASPAIIDIGDVLLRDPLPANTTFVSATGPGGYSCTNTAGTVNCTATAAEAIVTGGQRVFTITVTANAIGTAANTATADPDGAIPESNEGNNTGTATQQVIDPVDLLASVTYAPNPANTRLPYTVTATVTNTGGGPATIAAGTVVAVIQLPSGNFNISAAAPAGYSCTVSGQTVTCTATAGDTINAGDSRNFTVTARASTVDQGAAITLTVDPNNAIVESEEGNNVDSEPLVLVS